MLESQLQLARRVASDAFEASAGNLTKFKAAVLEDVRLDGCEDDEIVAIVARSCECFAYWQAEKIDKPTTSTAPIPIAFVPVESGEVETVVASEETSGGAL
jgi:hypothetical protein